MTGDNNPWAARARELAQWTWAHLVNRTDVWGGYWNDDKRDRLGRTTTRPAKARRGKDRLTFLLLERHFRATCAEDVVGLHTTSPENTSRWGAVELDHHGAGGNAPQANTRAALSWYAKLVCLGFGPLLTESNGKGGYHLRMLFREPVSTPRVHALLHHLVADYSIHGLSAAPEIFPKQPLIPPGGCGNWLRVPGRHHSCEHWPSVWDGLHWIKGEQAVALLLSLDGNSPDLLPAGRKTIPPNPGAQPKQQTAAAANRPIDNRLDSRIAAYAARLPHLGEGQGRDDVAYHFACWLVRDLQLADDAALAWLEQWDIGNRPPKGQARLKEILAGAHLYGRNAYGCGLPRPARRRLGHQYLRFRVEV
jgi:hypothetical protein